MKQVRHQETPAGEPGKLKGGFELDPSRHYVRVEREGKGAEGYLTPLDEMLEDGYRLESGTKAADTAHSRLALLSIDKAEYDRRQAEIEKESRAALKQTSGTLRQGEDEHITPGQPLTYKQLEGLIPQTQA